MNSRLPSSQIRLDWFYCLFIFLATLLVYLWSAPRTVVLEDDGLFILAAYFNGIAHPPGYPLFTLLGHFMTNLPIGSVAFRVHILSATFGALGCVCLWWLLRLLVTGRIYAMTASFTFGFSQIYWSQAIIAEVYTLNVTLFLLLFILTIRYSEQQDKFSRRLLVLMSFLYGLSLSNHWPLLILSTPMLLVVIWPQWRRLIRQLPYCLPFLLLGLFPYVWMVFRSQMDPPISFYGPIESWSDFWFVVSREGYSGMDNSPSAGWWDKWNYGKFVLLETGKQLGPAGIMLSIIGCFGQWRIWPKRIGVSLLLGYLCNTFILIGLLGFDYELFHRNIFRVYPLIAYAVIAIWLGLGMYILTGWITEHWSRNSNTALIRAGLGVIVIVTVLLPNIEINYRADNNLAETYAKNILMNLEQDSILFTSSDYNVATIGYLNKIDNIRPDISLYQTHGLIFSNRLFRTDKNTEEERVVRIDEFIVNNQRPVYYIGNLPHKYREELFGLYKRVNRTQSENNQHFIFELKLIRSIETLLLFGEPVDPWEKMLYRRINQEFCYFLRGVAQFNKATNKQIFFQNKFEQYCRTYHGYLGLIKQMLNDDKFNVSIVETYIDNAEKLRQQAITKEEYSVLDNYRAILLIRKDQYEEAVATLQRSIRIWPHVKNNAHKLLDELSNQRKPGP